MKLLFFLLAIFLLLFTFIVPEISSAKSPIPRHRDPQTVSSTFDVLSALTLFNAVLTNTRDSNYETSRELLSKLELLPISEGLRFVINRLTELVGILNGQMETAEAEIGKAYSLVQAGEKQAASTHLDAAQTSLNQANRTLENLQVAADTLALRLGPIAAQPEAPLSKAFQRLQALRNELAELLSRREALLEQLSQGYLPALQKPLEYLYPVTVSFDAPEQAYPGKPVTISGTISSPEGPPLREARVRLLLDDVALSDSLIQPSFEYSFTLPQDILNGRHLITLEFLPQGPYRSARARQAIFVSRIPPNIELYAPSVVFLQRPLRVSGKLSSQLGAASKAEIRLEVSGKSTTVYSDPEGGFSVDFDLPLTRFSVGPQPLDVKVVPQEPWLAQAEKKTNIFDLSIAGLLLLLGSLVYIIVVATIGWRSGRFLPRPAAPSVTTPGLEPVLSSSTLSAPVLPTTLVMSQDSLRGRIVASYHKSASSLARRHGIPSLAFFTLRDYVVALGSRAGKRFSELTMLAERALYRLREPEEIESLRAEELSEEIKKEP